ITALARATHPREALRSKALKSRQISSSSTVTDFSMGWICTTMHQIDGRTAEGDGNKPAAGDRESKAFDNVSKDHSADSEKGKQAK
ncbi:MAG: hypothetical protein Q9174_005626, partial [Haloplaca sp. 1 TL-2023]